MRVAWLLLASPVFLGGQSAPNGNVQANVMIVSVVHDSSITGGGNSSSNLLRPGEAQVDPIAWMTPEGQWIDIACSETKSAACRRFDRDYLSKPHTYTVVSADGKGTSVVVPRMTLDQECFGFGWRGSFPKGAIRRAAVGAESGELFVEGSTARPLLDAEGAPNRSAFARRMGSKLDSTKELRVYEFSLDGRKLIAIQRAFQDYADKPEYQAPNPPTLNWIFAIGEMDRGMFRILHLKDVEGDDNEQILGLIHLKNG